jgi:hypothetical protein
LQQADGWKSILKTSAVSGASRRLKEQAKTSQDEDGGRYEENARTLTGRRRIANERFEAKTGGIAAGNIRGMKLKKIPMRYMRDVQKKVDTSAFQDRPHAGGRSRI